MLLIQELLVLVAVTHYSLESTEIVSRDVHVIVQYDTHRSDKERVIIRAGGSHVCMHQR